MPWIQMIFAKYLLIDFFKLSVHFPLTLAIQIYNMDQPWKYAKWNNPDTKYQILYDSTYKRYLEKANYRDRK